MGAQDKVAYIKALVAKVIKAMEDGDAQAEAEARADLERNGAGAAAPAPQQ